MGLVDGAVQRFRHAFGRYGSVEAFADHVDADAYTVELAWQSQYQMKPLEFPGTEHWVAATVEAPDGRFYETSVSETVIEPYPLEEKPPDLSADARDAWDEAVETVQAWDDEVFTDATVSYRFDPDDTRHPEFSDY